MDIMAALDISFSGLQAQRARMNVIASNLANAQVTRTPEGGPYKPQRILLAAGPQASSFEQLLRSSLTHGTSEVQVLGMVDAEPSTRLEYDPGHPDANAQGYVTYPNISVMREMVDMLTASRLFEANVTAINAAKDMAQRALQIGQV